MWLLNWRGCDMSSIVNITNATVTMTSLELVGYINSQRGEGESELRHDHFMAKVPKVLGEEHAPKFRDMIEVTTGNGATRQSPIYRFPKREACLMAMSYSYELQAKVFDRMTELESRTPALPDFTNPVAAARAWADQVEQRERLELEKKAAADALAAAAPKIEGFDRIAKSDGSLCITDAAKTLQEQPRRLTQLMSEHQWIYRRPMSSGWIAYQDRIQSGHLEHKVTTGEKSHGGEWTSTQVRITPKGLAKLSELLAKERATEHDVA